MSLARQQAALARAVRSCANALLHGAAGCAWPRQRPLDAKRVCIYRIGNIGDTACAIPAMHAIRRAYPDAHLTLVTSPGKAGSIGARELLEGVSWLDEIVVYHAEDIATARGRLGLLHNLRARKFDEAGKILVQAVIIGLELRLDKSQLVAQRRFGLGAALVRRLRQHLDQRCVQGLRSI